MGQCACCPFLFDSALTEFLDFFIWPVKAQFILQHSYLLTQKNGVVDVARVVADALDVVAAGVALDDGSTVPFDELHADTTTSATTTITRRIGRLPSDNAHRRPRATTGALVHTKHSSSLIRPRTDPAVTRIFARDPGGVAIQSHR